MRLFDPHIHMSSRTTADYEAMAAAGIVAIVEPAFWLGQPRTHVGTFEDYFASLLGWEPFRASQFGIRHFCTLALNPKEANDERLADGVLALLPRYLAKRVTPELRRMVDGYAKERQAAGRPVPADASLVLGT